MANTLKLRGGTTPEVAAATLSEREIMVDTTKDVIVVGPDKNEMAVADGATFTGTTTFSGDVALSAGVTFGTSANANSLRIQNVGTPTANTDAATKAYVDSRTQNTSAADIKTAYESNANTEAFTTEHETKLSTLTGFEEQNVQADWNQASTTHDAYIHNKPSFLTSQTQVNWNQTDTAAVDFILNKPSLLSSIDEDDLVSDAEDRVPTQQSVKAYVDGQVATALPLSGGTLTGDVTFGATQQFGGRDVSADGTKLDDIELLAKDDQTGAEIKALYEAEADTNAFTTAEQTKLSDIETLADVTDATNVAAAGAVMEGDTTTASMSFVVDEDDMTSDLNTKVPTQQSVKAYVDTSVAGVVDSAPAALDTLNELAAALGDDENFATTVSTSIGEKLPKAGGTMTGDIVFNSTQTFGDIEANAKDDQTASEIKTLLAADKLTNAEIADDTITADLLADTAVTAASYGSSTAVPVITVDAQGRITAASTSSISSATTNLATVTGTHFVNVTSSTGNNTTIFEASSTAAGVMSTAHHDKLDGIATGATNVTNTNQLTNGAGFITATLTDEQVQDIAGGMVSGNTESGITVTYQDSDGTLDFAVASQTDENFTTTLKNKLDGLTAYTDSDVDTHLNQSNPTSGYVLSWTGSDYDWVAQSSGGSSTGDISFSTNEISTTDDQMVFKIDSDSNDSGYEGYYFYGGPTSNGYIQYWINGTTVTGTKMQSGNNKSVFQQSNSSFAFLLNEDGGNRPVDIQQLGNGSNSHINLQLRHSDARVRVTDAYASNVYYSLPRSTPSNGDVLTASDGSGTLGWAAPSSSFPASGGTFTGSVIFDDAVTIRGDDLYFYEGSVHTASIFAHSGGLNINQMTGDFKVSLGSSSDAEIAIPAGGAFYVKRGNTEKFKVLDTGVTIPLDSSGDVFQVTNSSGGVLISAVSDGTVRVKHAGSTKITTSSSGIIVTGALTAGGLVYPTTDGSAGQFLKTDGNGGLAFADAGGGGLTNFTESVSTSSPHSSTSGAVKLEASGTPARLDVYLHPKDDGALINGSESDGNKRGVYAVDWQATRNNADEVASGGRSAILGGSGNKATVNWSTAVGGRSNTASGVNSFVGGGQENTASGQQSFIGGGYQCTATGNSSTTAGGYSNDATSDYSTIGGGFSNTASSTSATVGGGEICTASGQRSTVAGGYQNTASGSRAAVGGGGQNTASGLYSNISGGLSNTASTNYSFVGGGQTNEAKTNTHAAVVGGQNNDATGVHSFIGGGLSNEATNDYSVCVGGNANDSKGTESAICGGSYNDATGSQSFVGGGASNTASSSYSFVGGGQTNEAKTNTHAAVVGGQNNDATGQYSFVGGGSNNIASGEKACIAGGMNNQANGEKSVVSGGQNNEAGFRAAVVGGATNLATGSYAFIGGGFTNIANTWNTFVGGGSYNEAKTNSGATVVGGEYNISSGGNSFVGGGYSNDATGSNSFVGGGNSNEASGIRSTVGGGQSNVASGQYSNILGGNGNKASAKYTAVLNGPYVEADEISEVAQGGGYIFSSSSKQNQISTLVFATQVASSVGNIDVANNAFGETLKSEGSTAAEIEIPVSRSGRVDVTWTCLNGSSAVRSGKYSFAYRRGSSSSSTITAIPSSPVNTDIVGDSISLGSTPILHSTTITNNIATIGFRVSGDGSNTLHWQAKVEVTMLANN